MTDYERLAADLTAAGIPSTVSAARRLAERDFYGGPVDILESVVLAQWVARPWKPEKLPSDGRISP